MASFFYNNKGGLKVFIYWLL